MKFVSILLNGQEPARTELGECKPVCAAVCRIIVFKRLLWFVLVGYQDDRRFSG